MMWLRRLLAVSLLVGVLAALLLAGCSKFDGGDPNPNIPPETTLSFAPDPEGQANYRVRMNWFGWDPDGEVAYYWTKWDTLDWIRVVSTDSVFLVSANETVDPQYGYEYHTFSVKAVDNDDAEDPTPETISFTAFTIVPETEIIAGPSGVTGPMVTFTWSGRDRDGVIVGYRYRLYQRVSSQWVLVAESPLLDDDTTTANFGPLAGLHKFQVWALDDAGAEDQTPATREFTCNPELAGPKLYIRTNVFGSFAFRGPVWGDEYNLPIPIFAGERLAFQWAADASDYGGQVRGYRHAYDDTSTWPAWSMFDTRFQVTPTIGRHSLYISALDNANVMTRARIYFDVVEATLDQYILIVDDYDWRETLPAWGTDAARTSFYDLLLAGYARDRVEWEPSQHVVGGVAQPPDVDALRGASTCIWYCDNQYTTIERAFDPNQVTYNALAGYVRVGGNLILEGQKVLSQILGREYPLEITAADTSAPDLFVRDFLHICRAWNSGANANKNAPYNYGYCFYGAVPADPDMFTPMYIDSLGKWSIIYNSAQPNYSRGGLPYVDRIETCMGTGLEIFTIDAFLNWTFENRPCATLYLSGDNHGNTAFFGFPLYYLQTEQVKAVMDTLLILFGEERYRGGGR